MPLISVGRSGGFESYQPATRLTTRVLTIWNYRMEIMAIIVWFVTVHACSTCSLAALSVRDPSSISRRSYVQEVRITRKPPEISIAPQCTDIFPKHQSLQAGKANPIKRACTASWTDHNPTFLKRRNLA